MPRNKKRAVTFVDILFFAGNYWLPRVFGLFALAADLTTYRFSVSKGWNLYSILIGTTFIYNYPRAIIQIIFNQKTTLNVTDLAELFQYGVTYILTAAIYIRNITLSRKIVDWINKGHDLFFESRSLTTDKVGVKDLILPYVGRAFYSYIGHVVLNFTRLRNALKSNSEEVGLLYKLLYFLPDIAITSAALRFDITVINLIMVVRRINVTLKPIIRQINQQKHETTYKKAKIYLRCMKRIEIAMAYNVKVFKAIKYVEQMLGSLIVFLSANAVMNSANLLFTIYKTVSKDGPLNVNNIILLTLHLSLYAVQLIFVYIPCSILKKELHKIGLLIHDVYVDKIDPQLTRTLETYSILLLLEESHICPGGLFKINKELFLSAVMTIISFAIFFIQFGLPNQ